MENWRRSAEEVQALMLLIELVARREIETLDQKDVRVRVMGRLDELPDSLREELERDCERTRDNRGLNLILALNYGGRREAGDAAPAPGQRVAESRPRPHQSDGERVAPPLYPPRTPARELLTRPRA